MSTKQRYYSLDVFRGATVALMIMVNNPGSWDYVFSPLLHASWHGCTPTDLVFPFFLFAVGNAMAFVLPGLQAAGDSVFWRKVIKRTLIIFLIGLFLNWWPFFHWKDNSLVFKDWVDGDNPIYGVRILGVLQRIALAYFFGSILAYFLKPKSLIIFSFFLLLVYWGLCYAFGTGDPYSLAGWFGNAVDVMILGESHLYGGEGVVFDPEGIMSTIPCVVQVVFGYLVGLFIKENGRVNWIWSKVSVEDSSYYKVLSALMVTGFIMLVGGWIWSLGFPINKKIWTSSYVLYTTGLAILTLGLMIWYVEIQSVRNSLTSFFVVFGKNPLFIYILSSILPSILEVVMLDTSDGPINALSASYEYIFSKVPGPPELGSLVFAVTLLALMWLIGYLLDKKKIYIKV